MRSYFRGLWRHPDFLKLWIGQTISVFGSQITILALPLVAASLLRASPMEMGMMLAVETVPYLLVGLFAGVWVDRRPRRPILIATNLGRAALLLVVPVVWDLHILGMAQLYAVAFLVGTLTVFFEIAYWSFLPTLVDRAQLLEGNSKLHAGQSAAEIVGPGLGGSLVQWLTAPVAIILDSCSFLVAALLIWRIQISESADGPRVAGVVRRSVWTDIGEGLRVVFTDRLLRVLVVCPSFWNFSWNVIFAVYVLFVTRELGLSPGLLGLLFAGSGVGSLIGASIAGTLARRIGLGAAIVWPPLLSALGALSLAFVRGPASIAVPALILGQFCYGFGVMIFSVNTVSLRQAITPDRLLGRVNATMRFTFQSALPIGAVVGGLLGTVVGLRPTMVVGAGGMLLVVAALLRSPVRALQKQPTTLDNRISTAVDSESGLVG